MNKMAIYSELNLGKIYKERKAPAYILLILILITSLWIYGYFTWQKIEGNFLKQYYIKKSLIENTENGYLVPILFNDLNTETGFFSFVMHKEVNCSNNFVKIVRVVAYKDQFAKGKNKEIQPKLGNDTTTNIITDSGNGASDKPTGGRVLLGAYKSFNLDYYLFERYC